MNVRGWLPFMVAMVTTAVMMAGCDGGRRSAEAEAARIVAGLPIEGRIAQLFAPTLAFEDSAAFAWARREARAGRLPGIWVAGGDAARTALTIDRLRADSPVPILALGSIGNGLDLDGATRFPDIHSILTIIDEGDRANLARALAEEATSVGLDIGFLAAPPSSADTPLPESARDPIAVGEAHGDIARVVSGAGILVGIRGYWTPNPDNPVIRWDRARLNSVENTIMHGAARTELAAIIPGTLRIPAVTGDSIPFAISRPAIDGLIRRDLGLREPLVVVDMSSGGYLGRRYGEADAAVRAIAAGADLVVGIEEPDAARAALLSALESGSVRRDRVDSAAVRVLAARIHRGAVARRSSPGDSLVVRLASEDAVALANRLDALARSSSAGHGAAGPFLPPEAGDSTPGMDAARLDRIDELMRKALDDGVFGAAALAIGRNGRLVRLRGYGDDVDPRHTIFDLASLTKVVATTTAAAILVERGEMELDAPVREYIPEWRGGPKDDVTIRHLLTHTSGLPAGIWLFGSARSPEDAVRRTLDQPLSREPGRSVEYSDLGMIILAEAVERVIEIPMDEFLAREVFAPLGMHDTMFLPPAFFTDRIVPTARTSERDFTLRGIVHDANAFRLGGVTGHAGLFSTARDLATFSQMMLNGGRFGAARILREETVRAFTRRQPNAGTRALGWDTPAGRSSAGSLFSAESFGHTGYTGTSIWIDPALDLFVVLLTNRTFSGGSAGDILRLRSDVHFVAADAVTDVDVERREGARPVR